MPELYDSDFIIPTVNGRPGTATDYLLVSSTFPIPNSVRAPTISPIYRTLLQSQGLIVGGEGWGEDACVSTTDYSSLCRLVIILYIYHLGLTREKNKDETAKARNCQSAV